VLREGLLAGYLEGIYGADLGEVDVAAWRALMSEAARHDQARKQAG